MLECRTTVYVAYLFAGERLTFSPDHPKLRVLAFPPSFFTTKAKERAIT